jgi:hypothetical protein
VRWMRCWMPLLDAHRTDGALVNQTWWLQAA